MKSFLVSAQLLSPTVVKQDRHSERSEGTRSLSGSVIRGALAQLYLHEIGSADDTFRQLFLDENQLRFGPLDPGPRLIPPTALSCKREPGFVQDRKHGVVDQLWRRIASRLTDNRHAVSDGLLSCSHPGCHADRKGHSGFWLEGESQPRAARNVRTVIGTHVGIDRMTHSAAESIFYTLQGLDGELVGTWQASDEAFRHLNTLLEQSQWEVRVGHHRTRGYGRVRLHPEGEAPTGSVERWIRWNDALVQWMAGGETDTFTFAVSLPAGAVLLDATLRYSLDPAEMVPWLPPLPGAEEQMQPLETTPSRAAFDGHLWCVCAHARHERIRGWQTAHGLPRQDEYALARGAVYAYRYRGPASGRQKLLAALQQIEAEGIGARRVEGFGRVVISDEFHQLCAPEKASCR